VSIRADPWPIPSQHPVGILCIPLLFLLAGCRNDMHDQPRYRPLASSNFFSDGRASRPLVPGTIARGYLRTDTRYYRGRDAGELVSEMPVKVTRELLVRGQERYNIYCSPCHGRTGDGEGMVVLRGFRHPPSFHQERLYNQPVGHFYDVITNGFGAMASYANRIAVEDRWAIVAYVRAIQLSQNATVDDVPPAERSRLQQEQKQGEQKQ
jgi:mono/diheme cytochrome c family protein